MHVCPERFNEAAALAPGPLRVTVRELFISPVERLLPERVSCIGVSFDSADVRNFKSSFLEGAADVVRTKCDPYGADGHISLVYVRGEHHDDAEAVVLGAASRLVGLATELASAELEDRTTKTKTLVRFGPPC